MHEIGIWECPNCGDAVELDYAELANCGEPMCEKCDEDMVLLRIKTGGK
jgi:ABC-type ATPase with predicted acetyltransferase domain